MVSYYNLLPRQRTGVLSHSCTVGGGRGGGGREEGKGGRKRGKEEGGGGRKRGRRGSKMCFISSSYNAMQPGHVC